MILVVNVHAIVIFCARMRGDRVAIVVIRRGPTSNCIRAARLAIGYPSQTSLSCVH